MSSYARNLAASAVFHFTQQRGRASKKTRTLARQFLPYALFLRKDGRILFLNREYKPLGFPPGHRAFVDYESDEFLSLTVPRDGANFTPTAPLRSPNMCMLYIGTPWANSRDAAELKRNLAEVLGMREFSADGEVGGVA